MNLSAFCSLADRREEGVSEFCFPVGAREDFLVGVWGNWLGGAVLRSGNGVK